MPRSTRPLLLILFILLAWGGVAVAQDDGAAADGAAADGVATADGGAAAGGAAAADGAAGDGAVAAPTMTFAEQPDCQRFVEAMAEVETSSAKLDEIFPQPPADTDSFLSGLFDGTHIMLEYGQLLFRASNQHESACKDGLREGNNPAEIIHLYEHVLTPTLRGHAFLLRVREAATALEDQDTVNDMDSAIAGYVESMNKLVSACVGDLPSDDQGCEALRAQIEERTATP